MIDLSWGWTTGGLSNLSLNFREAWFLKLLHHSCHFSCFTLFAVYWVYLAISLRRKRFSGILHFYGTYHVVYLFNFIIIVPRVFVVPGPGTGQATTNQVAWFIPLIRQALSTLTLSVLGIIVHKPFHGSLESMSVFHLEMYTNCGLCTRCSIRFSWNMAMSVFLNCMIVKRMTFIAECLDRKSTLWTLWYQGYQYQMHTRWWCLIHHGEVRPCRSDPSE